MSRTYRNINRAYISGLRRYTWRGHFFTWEQVNLLRKGEPPRPTSNPYSLTRKWYTADVVTARYVLPEMDWDRLARLRGQKCYDGFAYDRVKDEYRWREIDGEWEFVTEHELQRFHEVRKFYWSKSYHWEEDPVRELHEDWEYIHKFVRRNSSVNRQSKNGRKFTKKRHVRELRQRGREDLRERLAHWADDTDIVDFFPLDQLC